MRLDLERSQYESWEPSHTACTSYCCPGAASYCCPGAPPPTAMAWHCELGTPRLLELDQISGGSKERQHEREMGIEWLVTHRSGLFLPHHNPVSPLEELTLFFRGALPGD